jgi:hypothetical protein
MEVLALVFLVCFYLTIRADRPGARRLSTAQRPCKPLPPPAPPSKKD